MRHWTIKETFATVRFIRYVINETTNQFCTTKMDLKRVKNLYECFKKKDYEKIVQQVDSNFTWYAFGGPEFNPIAGKFRIPISIQLSPL